MFAHTRLWAVLACVTVAVTLGNRAEAWGRGHHGRHGGKGGHGHGFMRAELIAEMASELGVDESTLARIRELTYEANKELVDLKAEVHRTRVELHHQLGSDAPDTRSVMRLVEQLGAKETSVHKNRVGLLLAVRELLTPEQRSKLREILASRRAERGRMWEKRGRGRGGPGGDDPGAGLGPCRGDGPCGF